MLTKSMDSRFSVRVSAVDALFRSVEVSQLVVRFCQDEVMEADRREKYVRAYERSVMFTQKTWQFISPILSLLIEASVAIVLTVGMYLYVASTWLFDRGIEWWVIDRRPQTAWVQQKLVQGWRWLIKGKAPLMLPAAADTVTVEETVIPTVEVVAMGLATTAMEETAERLLPTIEQAKAMGLRELRRLGSQLKISKACRMNKATILPLVLEKLTA